MHILLILCDRGSTTTLLSGRILFPDPRGRENGDNYSYTGYNKDTYFNIWEWLPAEKLGIGFYFSFSG